MTDPRPADELVSVIADAPPAAPSVGAAPSALPRQAASAPTGEASELMIFREPQRP